MDRVPTLSRDLLAPGRDLPEFPDPRHNYAMEPLFHFALSLLSAGAPWLAGIIVVAVGLGVVSPVRLSLSIGDRSGRQGR
jgi:hypothetical protein